MRRIPLFLAAILLGAQPAVAQVCAGNPSFAGSPLNLAFAMQFNSNAQSYEGAIDWGGKVAFASAAIGWTTYNTILGGEAWDFGAGFGLQAKPVSRLYLCPALFLGYSDGPKDIGGSGVSYSEMHLATGLQGAVVALHRKTVEIIPNASFIVSNSRAKVTRPAAFDSTNWDSFGLLTLGLALGFNNEVTLGPAVTFPFGVAGGAATTYSVTFAVRLRKGS